MNSQVQFEERQTTTFFCQIGNKRMMDLFAQTMRKTFQIVGIDLASVEIIEPTKVKIICHNRQDARKIRKQIKEWNRLGEKLRKGSKK